MSQKPVRAVRFKVPWNGRQRGQIDRGLSPGVMATLVTYNKAEWVEAEEPRRRKKPSATVAEAVE